MNDGQFNNRSTHDNDSELVPPKSCSTDVAIIDMSLEEQQISGEQDQKAERANSSTTTTRALASAQSLSPPSSIHSNQRQGQQQREGEGDGEDHRTIISNSEIGRIQPRVIKAKKLPFYQGGVRPQHAKIVRFIGRCGFIAKGVVYGIIGVLILTNVSGTYTPNGSQGNESPQVKRNKSGIYLIGRSGSFSFFIFCL